MNTTVAAFALDYQFHQFTHSIAIHADCFEWMSRLPAESLHAVVTDPPYGVKEYNFEQIEKRANGNGGIWRIPPSLSRSCCFTLGRRVDSRSIHGIRLYGCRRRSITH